MDFIFGLSLVCTTLFGLLGLSLLFTQKGNQIANRILGAFFLIWAFDFMDGALLLKGFYLDYPNYALWLEPFQFLYGPLIYFYTLCIIYEKIKLKPNYLLHFVFFVFGIVLLLSAFHLQPINFKIKILKQIMTFKQPFESILGFVLVYSHFLCYILLSHFKLKRATRDFKQLYSSPQLIWLRNLLGALILLLALSALGTVLQFIEAFILFYFIIIVILLFTGMLIGRLLFRALDQRLPILPQNSSKKYAGNPLHDDEAERISLKILDALEKKELFLDSGLSLEQLSKNIGTKKRKVSQVINQHMKSSFFDLINTYRIDKAKEIFRETDDPNLTILEVLYKVGFNSKSSFNTQFKDKTGLTPSKFRQLLSRQSDNG